MKKLLAMALSLTFSVAVMTGCGAGGQAAGAPEAQTQEAQTQEAQTQEAAADAGNGAQGETAQSETAQPAEAAADQTEASAQTENAPEQTGEGGVITVAASPTPHAIILEHVKPILAEQGWDLQITEFEDYVQPNNVVESGEFTANYFQHVPYLNDFNAEHGTHLVSVKELHYEPFGIYPGVSNDLSAIKDGAEIAVPNDTTNEARALQLLQANGIITLKDGVGLEATVKDIVDNPHNVNIVELEAAQVSRVTGEADFVVLNGNYAMEAGFSVGKDALAAESADSEAAQTFANILVVKEGNENDPGVAALINALATDEVRSFIESEFEGSVIPLF